MLVSSARIDMLQSQLSTLMPLTAMNVQTQCPHTAYMLLDVQLWPHKSFRQWIRLYRGRGYGRNL